MAEMTAGRTRWGLTSITTLPLLVAAIGITLSMAAGILAASFSVSGTSFTISSHRLVAHDFGAFGSAATKANGSKTPTVLAGIHRADLDGICISTGVSIPVFGKYSLKITSSGTLSATNLKLDADQLTGDATFQNAEVGRDATTIDKGPARGTTGGVFSLQADSVVIDGIRVNAWSAAAAGTFKLPGLKLNVLRGNHSC